MHQEGRAHFSDSQSKADLFGWSQQMVKFSVLRFLFESEDIDLFSYT